MALAFRKTIPILRIFDVEKAKEFYLDYLGFSVDWGHHFEDTSQRTSRFPETDWRCICPSITGIAAPARPFLPP